MTAKFFDARIELYKKLCNEHVFTISKNGEPSIADIASKGSVAISKGMFDILEQHGITIPTAPKNSGQGNGNLFEKCISEFLEKTFLALGHLRPGKWHIKQSHASISEFEQYCHLQDLQLLTKKDGHIAAIIGNNYDILPDVIVSRDPESDEKINNGAFLIDSNEALHTSIREKNNKKPLLHASISCKFTLRTDRAQNARTEALSSIRNRKGRAPHICLVTAEPMPSRLASIALGTGDVDCVYHVALDELLQSIRNLTDIDDKGGYCATYEMLQIMINGKRLKDISDLPLDLVI